ncbi:MAG: hypothetical protein ACLGH8_03130 [Bacteroidia bacterium]
MALVIALLFLVKPVFPVIEYLANYSYIIKELCENRDKPMMHCNGKCHLMKQLAKASEHEKPLNEKKQVSSEQDLLFLSNVLMTNVLDYIPLDNGRNLTHHYPDLYCKLLLSFLLRPPRL